MPVSTPSCYICRCRVPPGTHIAQIVAVAHVHIWAHGQVLGIRAQLQAFGFLLSPFGEGAVVGGGREGGKGVQKHTSDQRDAGKFR